jgi:hypothetical protein
VCQVGHLQELYRDTRSTEHKKQGDKYCTIVFLSHKLNFTRYHKNAEVIFDTGYDMNITQILNIERDT